VEYTSIVFNYFTMPVDTKNSSDKQNTILKALVSDLRGGLKEIIFPFSVLKELTEKGLAYDGSSFQGINDINSSDSILWGDPETLVQVPASIAETENDEYWIMCDILGTDGKPHPNCARGRLKELQKDLAKNWNGGELLIGAEPEAFFVEKPEMLGKAETNGTNTNYFNPKDPKSFLIAEIISALQHMGFEIERGHAEVGHEQFEINWKYDTAHRTADRIQIYKLVSHKVARNYGFDVTFLPKPYPTRNGSGMHCHLSVAAKGKNLFYDKKHASRKFFSDTALHFIAGISKYTRAISAIANPTEVSFARLVPGFEAPCIIAVGEYNRSASCRVPAVADERTREKALRVEFRFPDPMTNPYLLAAAFIVGGLLGIQKKTPFKGFIDENLYALSIDQIRRKRLKMLPRNLWEAYGDFMMHPEFIDGLGKTIHKSFSTLLLKEIDECQSYANTESIRRHYMD